MILYSVHTCAGGVHGENQDRAAADPVRGTFVVADGMGGLADGALTAATVAAHLPALVSESVGSLTGAAVVGAVTAAVATLNDRVRRTARHGPGNTGAATALLVVRDGCALAVHLGDSRIYLARRGGLSQLTDDHAAAGGRLTRFVGMDGIVRPGVSVHPLHQGDRLLLCTDGLSGIGDAAVRDTLTGSRGLDVACDALVQAARQGGSTDDVTVIAVEYATGDGAR